MIRLGHPLYIHTCSTRICLPVILPRATPTENSERDQYRQNGKSRADLAHVRARYYLLNPDATVTTLFRNNTRSQPRTIALLRKSIHPLFASCCLFVHTLYILAATHIIRGMPCPIRWLMVVFRNTDRVTMCLPWALD